MSSPSLILATDLDGTFLGGSDADRRSLYEWLRGNDDAMLIFVTGRDLDFVRELVNSPGMPKPRYIIGDIGTSVWDGYTFEPVVEIEAEIAARWNDAGQTVAKMLDAEPALELQPVPFRYRRSYYYDPKTLPAQVLPEVEAAGFDWVLSADRFFDVLPRGVSKGPTLLRLLDHLGLPNDHVVVAGDTLNDLSLFKTRLKGVAVGNSEPALVERLHGLPWVYHSTAPGAGGIAEALEKFGFPIAEELAK